MSYREQPKRRRRRLLRTCVTWIQRLFVSLRNMSAPASVVEWQGGSDLRTWQRPCVMARGGRQALGPYGSSGIFMENGGLLTIDVCWRFRLPRSEFRQLWLSQTT